MSDLAIRITSLGKRFRIGRREPYLRFSEMPRRILAGTVARLRGESHDATFWALKDMSFDVRQGELVGIIGRNGAGKSTLLKILSRITSPTIGHVQLRGRVGALLEVGTGFHPELSGRENIFLNGAILGMRRAEINQKFDEIVDFAQIEAFLDTPVKHYSSGMYMRLAFAVAAHLEPEILVIDEVLAVGDLSFQQKCIARLSDAATGGATVLMVSHNMQSIAALCSRAICMEKGTILEDGDVADVTGKYAEMLRTAGPTIAADDLRHAETSEILSIDHVSFLNSAGQPATALYFKEPFCVRLSFHVKRDIDEFRFGIAILAPDGTRISVTHNTDKGLPSLSLKQGVYQIEATLQNLLVPGSYVLSVGSHSCKTTRALDWIPNAVHFVVLGASRDGVDRHDEYNAGFSYVPASWSRPSRFPGNDSRNHNETYGRERY